MSKTSFFSILLLLTLFLSTTYGQRAKIQNKTKKLEIMENRINKPENPYYSNTDTIKLHLTDAEWKKVLPEDVYEVTRHADTERPFTGKYWNTDEKGTYYCAACGNKLFRSGAKFSSSCGWPSFSKPLVSEVVSYHEDKSFNMDRTEVKSRVGSSHLGHVFDDGPTDKGGLRYCINSASLRFIPISKMEEEGYGYLISFIK